MSEKRGAFRVTPAKAGGHLKWIPAFAGMTISGE